MTAEEILKLVEDSGMSASDFAYGDFTVWNSELKKSEPREGLEALGDWEEVEQYGGEGQGDTWYSVKYFKDHDVYIRTDGYHQSHYGTDFDDGYGVEVKPVEKTVTVYEEI